MPFINGTYTEGVLTELIYESKCSQEKKSEYMQMETVLCELPQALDWEEDFWSDEKSTFVLTSEDYNCYPEYAKAIIKSGDDSQLFMEMMRTLKEALMTPATEEKNKVLLESIKKLDKSKSSQNSNLLSKVIGVGLKVLGALVLVAAVSSLLVPIAPAAVSTVAGAATVAAVGKALATATFYITLGAKYIAGTYVAGQLAAVIAQAGVVAYIGTKVDKAGNYMFSGTAEKRKMMNSVKATHEKLESERKKKKT